MFHRLLQLPKNHHFFLFGARNTGKTTLMNAQFPIDATLKIDLLDEDEFLKFDAHPGQLSQIVAALPNSMTHIIIDEIQRIPKLLNAVHKLMTETNKKFILSGSSARKLKRGGANLLAGRAFVYHLYPLSFLEIGNVFDIDSALQWGTLPGLFACTSEAEKKLFLQAYAKTYLKEEIWTEQLIRQLNPFRKFLEVAAQCNAKIINYSNIARDVGVDDKTVINYFSILEDTLIGFFLEPFHSSFRKRLATKPKFYFFDTGVVKALSQQTSIQLVPQTSAYGEAFEHYIILECVRLASYFNLEYRFSYLQTQSDAEIDLIVERPGKKLLAIEIKSTKNIHDKDLSTFISLTQDLPDCEALCLCQEKYPKQIANVLVLPWQDGLRRFFTETN